MADADEPLTPAQLLQHLQGLRREFDALRAHSLSLRVQFDLLLMAIERADFRMRGFNPILDAVDRLHRDLIAQRANDLSDADQRAAEQTELLLEACENLRKTMRMD
ncbi:MAG: hypothetical protein ACK44F_14850 [Roseococcus sp.]